MEPLKNNRSLDEFEVLELLGKGAQGSVHKVREKSSGKLFAMKIIEDIDPQEKAVYEAMKNFSHPNLLLPLFCLEKKDEFLNKAYFIMFFDLQTKSLKQQLNEMRQQNKKFPISIATKLIQSLFNALIYLKSKCMPHRDLKPDNILINDDNQEDLNFYICDFGCSKLSPNKTDINTVVGTRLFLSPELYESYENQEPTSEYNPFKSDIFSLGLVIVESLTLKSIKGLNKNENLLETKLGELLIEIDNDYKKLEIIHILKGMLKFDPQKRISLEMARDLFEKSNQEKQLSKFQVSVKGSTGHWLMFSNISINETIFEIFLKVHEKTTWPLEQFILVLVDNGKPIRHKDFFKKVTDFGIKNESQLVQITNIYFSYNKYTLVNNYFMNEYKQENMCLFLSKVEERFAWLVNNAENNYLEYRDYWQFFNENN